MPGCLSDSVVSHVCSSAEVLVMVATEGSGPITLVTHLEQNRPLRTDEELLQQTARRSHEILKPRNTDFVFP